MHCIVCIACVHYGGNENSSHAGGRELICIVMHFTLMSAPVEGRKMQIMESGVRFKVVNWQLLCNTMRKVGWDFDKVLFTPTAYPCEGNFNCKFFF